MHAGEFAWGPYLAFALVNSFTPGPNVILLASSGGQWGRSRTLPHLLGVCLGFPAMIFLVQLGADQAFRSLPGAFSAMTFVSLAYVLWLAWRICAMGLADDAPANRGARPMTFFGAAMFQWVNGKAWQVALMIATLFAANTSETRVLMAATVGVITFAAGLLWIEAGRRIASFLTRRRFRRIYFATLAIALLAFTLPRGIAALIGGL